MVLASTPPPPPAIEQPAPYEVSYGTIRGVAAPGAVRLVIRSNGNVVRVVRLRQRRFVVTAPLPLGEQTIRLETVDRRGRRAGRSVPHVLVLPRAARPRLVAPRTDGLLRRDLLRLTNRFEGTSATYVQSLTSGAGAAWNADASFPAASTLKLAIAVTALARTNGKPQPGSRLDVLLRRMLVHSDNAAANDLERYFAGSTSGGSAYVNGLMRSIGLVDSEMYGGYTLGTRSVSGHGAGIPTRVEEQPLWGRGKRTTAHDLAHLVRAVWLAGAGKGPLRRAQPGFSAVDARYVLYLLAHVRDPGKLDRIVGRDAAVVVAHKAGWVKAGRHDVGLVFWRGGVFVAAVMTYRAAGAGTSSDVLAGHVAAYALRRFRG